MSNNIGGLEFVLLLFEVILAAALIQNVLQLFILHAHVVRVDVAPAHWAHIVRLKPFDDALGVESVSHVAPERRHLVPFLKVNQADDAVLDAPETSLVVGDLGSLVDNTLPRFPLPVLVGAVGAPGVNEAGAEDDGDGDGDHDDEGLGQDEAYDDSEDGETEAGVGVVAVWREAIERL